MVNIKSHRPRSSEAEKLAAVQRAVKVMRGTPRNMSRNAVAEQAARYVPEAKAIMLRFLSNMNDEEFGALIEEKRSL